ncbi:MAG: restriction endonuclease-like protein [Anaeromicrobium sp.]|jgi:predicted component of viral defense system (DUF524 family)|uniref:restriction endonuclease-like protein n=1 Tax=Anaeromicrobium sp. TaxID=1929132 RepID=UPI0025CCB442|nr:restriction endonuclease-like protein [Anaeromicrobium sp.]MCT4592792.1 restriction endonuclease-like protein [Anaeromicrobium sp.]
MDLQPSGNKNKRLLHIKTDKIDFVIKGKKVEDNFYYDDEVFKDSYYIEALNGTLEEKIKPEKATFYEYENYEIIIENMEGHNIEVYHENPNIRNEIDYITESKRIMSGVINFGSDIGLSEFRIKINGVEHLLLRIEVFPKKINYKEDYKNILRDVNEEIYNMSFDFLKKTYFNMAISQKDGNTLSEYYSILKCVYKELIKNIRIIIESPHHSLKREDNILPYHKIKRSSKETVKWLQRNSHHIVRKNEKIVPIKALESKKITTFNTHENQFLKYILNTIVEKLERLKKRYKNLKRANDALVIEDINKMIREMNILIKTSFFNKVSNFNMTESFSLVMRMAPGYKNVYKYYLMLNKALSIESDLFRMSMKDLATLYEYWCFIKINSILRKKFNLVSSNMIKINNNGIFVTLKKGKEAKATYEHPVTKEKFTIAYNTNVDSQTVGQKPDNVFRINKEGSPNTYDYIFDAKYKIEDDIVNIDGEKVNVKRPKDEDINTMHRYRDAVLHESKDKKIYRTIFGAFVLFPYDNEELYKKHKFYKSIDKVHIGGIPFLPNSTSIMEELLDELIGESRITAYNKKVNAIGEENDLKESYFNQRDVLVGVVKKKEQLKANMENNFYHIPANKINLTNGIKYVALYEPQKGVKYYGKVENIEYIKRNQIKELPKESHEIYVKINLKRWQELKRRIGINKFAPNPIWYTSLFLLRNVEKADELCIKSKEEYRLYLELIRYTENSELVDRKDYQNKGFNINNYLIRIDGDNIKVIYDNNEVEIWSIREFMKKPRLILKSITFRE